MPKIFFKKNLTLILILLIAFFFLFYKLNNTYFWEDEADTAIYSLNIQNNFLPSGWNGINLYAYRNGLHLNSEMNNRTSPWLQFYITALAFKTIGKTVFAGRLPFAVIGFIVVILFYRYAFQYSYKKNTAAIASLYLIFSPSFLMFTRQCRYYSLVILFSILIISQYSNISIRNRKSIYYFSLICICFFYSNYFIFFAFFSALLFTHILLEYNKEKFIGIIAGFLLSAIFWLPFIFFSKPWKSVDIPLFSIQRLDNAAHLLWWYLRDYNAFSFFQVFFILFLAFVFIEKTSNKNFRFKIDRKALFIITFILFSTLFLSIISPQPYKETDIADIRYAVGLLPFFCLLLGYISNKILELNKIIGFIIIAVALFTNFFTLIPAYKTEKIKFYFYDYAYELFHKNITPSETVINYLQNNSKQNDTILVRPDNCIAPLLFHFNNKLLFCGVLPEDNKHILPHNKKKIPDYIYSRNIAPDWIITFGMYPYIGEFRKYFDFINANKINYSVIAMDVFCMDVSRPELLWHSFYPVKNFPPQYKIYIFKKRAVNNLTL